MGPIFLGGSTTYTIIVTGNTNMRIHGTCKIRIKIIWSICKPYLKVVVAILRCSMLVLHDQEFDHLADFYNRNTLHTSKQYHKGPKPDAIGLLGYLQRWWRAQEDKSIKNMARAERFSYKGRAKAIVPSGITKKCVDTKIGHTTYISAKSHGLQTDWGSTTLPKPA